MPQLLAQQAKTRIVVHTCGVSDPKKQDKQPERGHGGAQRELQWVCRRCDIPTHVSGKRSFPWRAIICR